VVNYQLLLTKIEMKTQIIPVIHMINQNQVLTNVNTCVDCGIEKVFLINHQSSWQTLITVANVVKKKYPNLWIGLNLLDMTTEESLSTDFDFDGLWCDATIDSITAEKIRKFNGKFFGGLAFKYQPQPDDIEIACIDAIVSTDVATTSGVGTGQEAELSKIKTIREHLGEHPMAIASGVSINNIHHYSGVVDYLLVATSITTRSEMIIGEKLIELIKEV